MEAFVTKTLSTASQTGTWDLSRKVFGKSEEKYGQVSFGKVVDVCWDAVHDNMSLGESIAVMLNRVIVLDLSYCNLNDSDLKDILDLVKMLKNCKVVNLDYTDMEMIDSDSINFLEEIQKRVEYTTLIGTLILRVYWELPGLSKTIVIPRKCFEKGWKPVFNEDPKYDDTKWRHVIPRSRIPEVKAAHEAYYGLVDAPSTVFEEEVVEEKYVPRRDDRQGYDQRHGQEPRHGQGYDQRQQGYDPRYGRGYDPRYGQGYDPRYGQQRRW